MYCQKECHDKDSEEIEDAIASLRESNTSAADRLNADSNSGVDRLGVGSSSSTNNLNNLNNLTTDNDASGFKYIEAGGFRLLVPIKKEN
jgi:hypothetical protein